MKRLKKKGSFDTINAGMIALISFVLIVTVTLLMVSQFKQSDLVCDSDAIVNTTVVYDSGNCLMCVPTGNHTFSYNTTSGLCYNATNVSITASPQQFTGAAYNGTLDLQEAAFLPPQFAQLIAIVVVIVGILGILAAVGLGVYNRMNR